MMTATRLRLVTSIEEEQHGYAQTAEAGAQFYPVSVILSFVVTFRSEQRKRLLCW